MPEQETTESVMSPPPYELRLDERPQDRAEFDDWVSFLLPLCRPGGPYRLPWAGRKRRREARARWEKIVRTHMGRAYGLGRRLYPPEEAHGTPLFVILGYNDFDPDTGVGGPLVLSSRTVATATWQRCRQGFTAVPFETSRGRQAAKLPNETITVTCQMKDFTQLRGEFPQIMADLWKVLAGTRP